MSTCAGERCVRFINFFKWDSPGYGGIWRDKVAQSGTFRHRQRLPSITLATVAQARRVLRAESMSVRRLIPPAAARSLLLHIARRWRGRRTLCIALWSRELNGAGRWPGGVA